MSSSVDLALKNFRYQIEEIVPVNGIPREKFYWHDLKRLEDRVKTSGANRLFCVLWESSDADGLGNESITDMYDRWAVHRFELRVAYSTDYDLLTLQTIIGQDRHDIIKRLRDTDYFVGIKDDLATAATAATGIQSRIRISDKLEKTNEKIWTLSQLWDCVLQEVE